MPTKEDERAKMPTKKNEQPDEGRAPITPGGTPTAAGTGEGTGKDGEKPSAAEGTPKTTVKTTGEVTGEVTGKNRENPSAVESTGKAMKSPPSSGRGRKGSV